jgi:hypothetical protein
LQRERERDNRLAENRMAEAENRAKRESKSETEKEK